MKRVSLSRQRVVCARPPCFPCRRIAALGGFLFVETPSPSPQSRGFPFHFSCDSAINMLFDLYLGDLRMEGLCADRGQVYWSEASLRNLLYRNPTFRDTARLRDLVPPHRLPEVSPDRLDQAYVPHAELLERMGRPTWGRVSRVRQLFQFRNLYVQLGRREPFFCSARVCAEDEEGSVDLLPLLHGWSADTEDEDDDDEPRPVSPPTFLGVPTPSPPSSPAYTPMSPIGYAFVVHNLQYAFPAASRHSSPRHSWPSTPSSPPGYSAPSPPYVPPGGFERSPPDSPPAPLRVETTDGLPFHLHVDEMEPLDPRTSFHLFFNEMPPTQILFFYGGRVHIFTRME